MTIDARPSAAESATDGKLQGPRAELAEGEHPDSAGPAIAPDPAIAADLAFAGPAGLAVAAGGERRTTRLRWLDALRGIAVLAVVYEHFSSYLFPGVKAVTVQWVHAGTFGVMLFFLVSGYIVPASIERRGSVRDFWIGRLFRLYPAYLVTIFGAIIIAKLGPGSLPAQFDQQRTTTLLAHLTMLHEVVGVDNLQYQFWTLAYEMCFYLVVTVVFIAGVHRFSAEIAVLLAGAAAALGGYLPDRAFAGDPMSVRNLAVVTALVLFAGVVAVSSRRRAVIIAGAVLLGVFVASMLGANQEVGGWEGFVILAVMFTGTAIYRAEQRQIAWQRAVAAVGVVVVAAVVDVYVNGHMWWMVHQDRFPVERSWLGGLLLAMVVFGIGMLLRHRRVPGWLAWLGAVSYSVYLLHYIVIYLFKPALLNFRDNPLVERLGMTAVYLAVLLAVCWASHRFVELPFQGLGRRVVRRLRDS